MRLALTARQHAVIPLILEFAYIDSFSAIACGVNITDCIDVVNLFEMNH